MERIDYNIADRDTLFETLRAAGKTIVEDVTIDLDTQGVPQTCYCMVVDAPEIAPQPDLLAEADARILDLEYALCLAEGGLT